MRIAILSDFHLGYDRFRADALKQAEEALNLAAEKADVLLIPGDIFDNREPSPDVLAEGITLFRELSGRKWGASVADFSGEGRIYTKAPIVAIPGTHERRAEGVEDPVDLLGLAGLLVDATNATVTIQKGDEKIAIRGLGGISEDRFKEILKREDPKPVDGLFNVFFFHQSVYELLPFSEEFIRFDDLPRGFDLYVDGHIHSRVEGSAHGKPFLIPGSTVLTQLKDGEQDAKGFYLYDTENRKYEFNTIRSRRFAVRKIDIEGKEPSQVVEEIENAIKKESTSGDVPIVRVELVGKLKDGYKNMEINIPGIVKKHGNDAIVEIGKDKIEVTQEQRLVDKSEIAAGVSVKDFGISIFVEKVKKNGYNLKKSPVELFDELSADESKEKVVKKVMSGLLS